MEYLNEAVDHKILHGKILFTVTAIATGTLASAETIGEACLRILPTTAAFVISPLLSEENRFRKAFTFQKLTEKVSQVFHIIIDILTTLMGNRSETKVTSTPNDLETASGIRTTSGTSSTSPSTTPATSKPKPNPSPAAAAPLFFQGKEAPSPAVKELVDSLKKLPPMDKSRMDCLNGKNRAARYRDRMKKFMENNFGLTRVEGKAFVPGVPAFTLKNRDHKSDRVFTFSGKTGKYAMTSAEIKQWQESYRVFVPEECQLQPKHLRRRLRGTSKEGEESFSMKHIVRLAKTPIFRDFDGKIINRSLDEATGEIYLVSASGVNFAGCKHDSFDIQRYIINWKDVVQTNAKNEIVYETNGRDMSLQSNAAKAELNADLFLRDIKEMTRLRLRAQDQLGVEVVVESGFGLGGYAGFRLGYDLEDKVRTQSAQAIKEVLEEEQFKNIKLVCFALPIFRKSDAYHFYSKAFANYKGKAPVLILDQDMHKIADAAAVSKNSEGKRVNRYVTSELNPADTHGVFGEYWEGDGPGMEEKLAYTTAGLLTQHHACNRNVVKAPVIKV